MSERVNYMFGDAFWVRMMIERTAEAALVKNTALFDVNDDMIFS